MTADLPADVAETFDAREAFERVDGRYRVTTTAFEGYVTATAREDWATDYEVTVAVPTLQKAVAGDVGEAVQAGWLDTLKRRLEDAPKATRVSVDLEGFDVATENGTVTVTYEFSLGSADQAAAVAKAFVEYVEGTYVEGVVPGYEYESPVTDLLSAAATSEGERGGTPL